MVDAAHRAPPGGPPGNESVARIMLRPMGSPLPLGFFAFGIGTLILSGLQLGWVPQNETQAVAVLLITFVFPIEFVPSILAFLARDAPGGTTLSVFGASWLALGVNLLVGPTSGTSTALALFLFCLVAVFAILGTLSAMGKGLITLIMAVAAPRYLLLGLYHVTGVAALQAAAGYVGLVLTAVAFYGALGLLLEEVKQKSVLPMLRRGASQESFTGDLDDQLDRLKHEAGVREQL